jgi:hypothetical protein
MRQWLLGNGRKGTPMPASEKKKAHFQEKNDATSPAYVTFARLQRYDATF